MVRERHKVVPAVYCFLQKNGKILLTRRMNTGYEDGKYMVPSGHVEKGESLTAATVRETMEEVGVSVRPEDLRLVHTMYRPSHDATGERADFFFEAEKWQGEPQNCEPEKCDEVGWFPLGNLPENIVEYLHIAIVAAAEGILLSEPWWNDPKK